VFVIENLDASEQQDLPNKCGSNLIWSI